MKTPYDDLSTININDTTLAEAFKIGVRHGLGLAKMKGNKCPFKGIICQEGYCSNCNIFLKEIEA